MSGPAKYMEKYDLTAGQVELLRSLMPLNKWDCMLKEYAINGKFDWIDEYFWQQNRPITFDDFYYAGIDQTVKVPEDDARLAELNILKDQVIRKIPNIHYHDIAKRTVKDYTIGYKPYEDLKQSLIYILGLM